MQIHTTSTQKRKLKQGAIVLGIALLGMLYVTSPLSFTGQLSPFTKGDETTRPPVAQSVADLSLILESKQQRLVAGQRAMIVAKITNQGPARSNGAVVSFAVPRWTTFIPTLPTCVQVGPQNMTCTTSFISSGQSVLVPIQFSIGRELGVNVQAHFDVFAKEKPVTQPIISDGKDRMYQPTTVGGMSIDPNMKNNVATLSLPVGAKVQAY